MENIWNELDDQKLTSLSNEAMEWAMAHGVLMYSKKDPQKLVHAPFTLLPSPLPSGIYQQAMTLARPFNTLVHRISLDTKFILSALRGTEQDAFTTQLLRILQMIEEEGVKQPLSLGIHRSDYMLHCPTGKLKESVLQQVELNTIAASFSNLSAFVSQMHRFLIERYELPNLQLNVPENETQQKIPQAIATAWKMYGNARAVVMMIVHPGETNTFDQKWLEYLLWTNHKIKLIRRSLLDVATRGSLEPNTFQLHIDGQAVAIAYYRAGYTPDDYPTSKEWDGRLMIERSRCIKCPTIAYHLVGSKKMQQVLSTSGVLEKFVNDAQMVQQLRASFTGLYSLTDGEEGVAEIIQKALKNPENFVMKPQREGGGNNLYGTQIVEALNKFSPTERSAHILMDRIVPPPIPNVVLREGERSKISGVGELGIFGVFLGDKDHEVLNDAAGYLLRTKVATVEDGGVAAGVAVLDSPYLTNN